MTALPAMGGARHSTTVPHCLRSLSVRFFRRSLRQDAARAPGVLSARRGKVRLGRGTDCPDGPGQRRSPRRARLVTAAFRTRHETARSFRLSSLRNIFSFLTKLAFAGLLRETFNFKRNMDRQSCCGQRPQRFLPGPFLVAGPSPKRLPIAGKSAKSLFACGFQ